MSKTHAVDETKKDALFQAVSRNDIDATAGVLRESLRDFNAVLLRTKDENGSTPLHIAAGLRNIPMVGSLLGFVTPTERLEVLQEQDADGNTPLAVALKLETNPEAIITEIFNQVHPHEFITLYLSAQEQKETMFMQPVIRGRTLFEVMVDNGSLKAVEMMVDSLGSEAERTRVLATADRYGKCPLGYAVENGNREMLVLLDKTFSSGWEELLQQQNKNGETLFERAARNKDRTVMAFLRKRSATVEVNVAAASEVADGNGDTSLHDAVREGDAEAVGKLLKAGDAEVALNAVNDEGNTPLHIALLNCYHIALLNGYHEVVAVIADAVDSQTLRQLLEAKNHNGNTPLYIAALNSDGAMMQLLDKNFSPNEWGELLQMKDEEGQTVLHAAAYNEHSEVMAFLLEKCDTAKIDVKTALKAADNDGNVPLYLAIRFGDGAMMQLLDETFLLTEWDELLQMKGGSGQTVFHAAALSQNSKVMAFLLEKCNTAKIDVKTALNAVDDEGNIPLYIAVRSGDGAMMQLFDKKLSPNEWEALLQMRDGAGQTVFHAAAQNPNSEVMAFFLSKAGDAELALNAVDDYDNTPLHIAAAHGWLEVLAVIAGAVNPQTLRQLLEAKDHDGDTPLHIAVRSGDGAMMQLFDEKLSPNEWEALLQMRDGNGQTVFHAAPQNPNSEVMAFLLNKAVEVGISVEDALSAVNDTGDTPYSLHDGLEVITVIAGALTPQTLRQLLKVKDHNGRLPLHMDALNGDGAMMQLLDKTLSPNEWEVLLQMRDGAGQTVFHAAPQNPNSEVMAFLLNKAVEVGGRAEDALNAVDDDGDTPLHHALQCGGHEMLVVIADAVAPQPLGQLLKVKNHDGNTPLHYAAGGIKGAMIQLLDKEFSSNEWNELLQQKNKRDQTLFHMACGELVAFLFDKAGKVGVDVKTALEAEDIDGNTPLHTAARYGNTEMVAAVDQETLGRLLEINNCDGQTPLHMAVEGENTETVGALLKGLDAKQQLKVLQARDSNGNTPLHIAIAVEGENTGMVMVLLKGLDAKQQLTVLRARDMNGNTPLHLAVERGDTEMVTVLLKGLDVADQQALERVLEIKNNDGNTPLSLARDKELNEVVALFEKVMLDRDAQKGSSSSQPKGPPASGVVSVESVPLNVSDARVR